MKNQFLAKWIAGTVVFYGLLILLYILVDSTAFPALTAIEVVALLLMATAIFISATPYFFNKKFKFKDFGLQKGLFAADF